MKLISCHIENFGKLRDFTYYFEDGLSVLFAENGWGKSTFAAFLKVMFYGFDGDNRRNEDGNERLRFRPWGGGVYGGSVTWSRGGKSYRMLRTFGARRKEDTFALYDEETGLPSSDFSENIGEELFGIDRDSFRRTVFWSQSDHDTSVTTSIQAKIGDLSSQQDDFPAYDDAVKRLRREMDRLRTGSLSFRRMKPGSLFWKPGWKSVKPASRLLPPNSIASVPADSSMPSPPLQFPLFSRRRIIMGRIF